MPDSGMVVEPCVGLINPAVEYPSLVTCAELCKILAMTLVNTMSIDVSDATSALQYSCILRLVVDSAVPDSGMVVERTKNSLVDKQQIINIILLSMEYPSLVGLKSSLN